MSAPDATAKPNGGEGYDAQTGLPTTAAGTKQVALQMGVVPTSIEEGWRLASIFARSQLVPKDFRNKPEDVLVAIQMGAEVGLPPMQALQSIAVINGRPSLWGDGFLALVVSSPLYESHEEYYEVDGQRRDGVAAEDLKKDTTAAVCTFCRKGRRPVTRRFTIAQAKRAGLLGKDGPWQTYPERMLAMRARSWAGRDQFPDLLRGIRTTEEAMDEPPEAVIDVPKEVRRVSEMSRDASAPATPEPPKPDPIVLGPIGVKSVDPFLGGHLVTLSDGRQIVATEELDAIELQKFLGSQHKLRLTCEKVEGDGLVVRSFAIVD
jgi:hypothetical protein